MADGVKVALDKVLDDFEGDDLGQVLPPQNDLFEDPANMAAPSPLGTYVKAAVKKGAGRPAGSPNKRTQAVVDYLLSQNRHPLHVMAETYSMSPVQLAERLGLQKPTDADGNEKDHYSNDTIMELYKLQLRMAEAVAPFVAQRQAQAVAVSAKAGVNIAIMGVSVPARAGDSGKNSGEDEADAMPFGLSLGGKSDD